MSVAAAGILKAYSEFLRARESVIISIPMSRTLTISDELYQRLLTEAGARGFRSVEQLLEEHAGNGRDLATRQAVVEEIDRLRTRLFAQHGEMPDSTSLIREDRLR